MRSGNGNFKDWDFEDAKASIGLLLGKIVKFLFDAVINIGFKSWLIDAFLPKFGKVKIAEKDFLLFLKLCAFVILSEFFYLS